MNINSIIFPAPITSSSIDLSKYKNEIIFIPKPNQLNSKKEQSFIPCMLYESRKSINSNKYIIYFHGNAEDIFNSNYTVDLTRTVLPYSIISVEYPGYSIYNQDKDDKTIEEDSIIVYDYIVNSCNINEKDIVICGRSIGSGPSIYLCSKRRPGALVLVSPFTSICNVVKSLVGFVSLFIKDRFVNISLIDKVACPVLFIHGQKDNIVPFTHTIELSQKCKSPMEIILPESMDHNEINVYDDFLEPLTTFLQRYNLIEVSKEEKRISLPEEIFLIPSTLDVKQNKDFVTSFVRKYFNK